MKRITFLLSLIMMSSVFGQSNQTDSQGRKQGAWEKYKEGTSILIYKGQFKNDKPYGKFVYYYEDGKVKSIALYRGTDGVTCLVYHYHKNQKVMAAGKYVNQKKDSLWTFYDKYGAKLSEESFKNDKRHGEVILYFETIPQQPIANQVMEISFYRNGVLHGDRTQYYPSGKVKMKGKWIDGNPDGVVITYNTNGGKIKEVRWKAAVKHGWSKFYDDAGNPVGKIFYWYGKELKGKELEAKLEELRAQREQ